MRITDFFRSKHELSFLRLIFTHADIIVQGTDSIFILKEIVTPIFNMTRQTSALFIFHVHSKNYWAEN